MMGLNKRGFVLFCVCAVLIPSLSGCEAANDLITGETTSDPQALLVAEIAGHGSAGLETALIGAGLLTEIPAGTIPTEALAVVEVALNTLISNCLTFEAISGISSGFDIKFADGGCGIPLTNFKLQGGFKFETLATDTTSEWIINFTQFQVAGVSVNGLINITTKDKTALDFNIVNLDVAYNSFSAKIPVLTGSLTTENSHTDITFNGAGSVIYKDVTYAFVAKDLERHTKTDCYPEKGALSVTITGADGKETAAAIAFDDLVLDSDDTGKVSITYSGTTHTAKLPSRICDAFLK